MYNRRHPTEHYRISLKLTSDPLRVFFLSPGSKSAYPFKRLEDKITTFLKVRVLFTQLRCVDIVGNLWLILSKSPWNRVLGNLLLTEYESLTVAA